jgi:hypothetical protein
MPVTDHDPSCELCVTDACLLHRRSSDTFHPSATSSKFPPGLRHWARSRLTRPPGLVSGAWLPVTHTAEVGSAARQSVGTWFYHAPGCMPTQGSNALSHT